MKYCTEKSPARISSPKGWTLSSQQSPQLKVNTEDKISNYEAFKLQEE